jgi:hypothetical protein
MSTALEKLQAFRAANTVKGAPRTILIIVMAVLALVIGIMAAVIGRNYGDENCNCIGVNDSGFRAFAIAMIAVGIPMIIVSMIFFGCTTQSE